MVYKTCHKVFLKEVILKIMITTIIPIKRTMLLKKLYKKSSKYYIKKTNDKAIKFDSNKQIL